MISNEDYFRFAKERDTIQANVKAILERFPECREDYRFLVNYYWYYIDKLNRFIPKEVLRELTPPESVTRAYRKVVSLNLSLQPSAKTRHQRDIQLERYRKYYSPKDKNYKID